MISFKGCHFPKPVILHAIYFYLRYSVSLRDLEEILAERGVVVDLATLSRCISLGRDEAIQAQTAQGTSRDTQVLLMMGALLMWAA